MIKKFSYANLESALRLQDMPIRRKLRLIIMVASSVALLLVSAGFVSYELFTYRQDMARRLMSTAEMVGAESTASLSFEDNERAAEVLSALPAEKHIIAAALYKDGHVFAKYHRADSSAVSLPPVEEKSNLRFKADSLLLFHEIKLKGEVIGTLYLKSDLQEMADRKKRYAAIILLFMLASTVVTYFLSALLQRIISRPISHLVETAHTVSTQKNYSVRAEKHGKDELGQLIDGFNEMLGQIQHRDVALQESHDGLEKRVAERTHELVGEISERKAAEAALKQQFARLHLINQITHTISERQDIDSILHVVLRQLEDHMGLDFGGVFLFDEPANTLNLAALRIKNSMLVPRLGLSEGMVLNFADAGVELCKKGQTIYLSDTFKQPALLLEKLAGAGLRSAVAIPLLVDEKLFGVMFTARIGQNDFTSSDCEFLRMLNEHVALAAHQAQLHSQLADAYNELRETQQTAMQQERLKALGQMASGIAHDVNNALSPVVGFAELMLRGEAGLSAAGKRQLKHILTAGEDIAHIVARLREFYRQREQGESLQELNLNRLAEQVVDMTRPRWRDIPQSNGITINVKADLAMDVPDLAGIESEVREALTNLLLNAVDALPSGGNIHVRTHVKRLDGSPTHVALEVSDTGIGMNEETRRRCLEPFFSTKGKRGTGLGLAMVYGVVERHDGSVEIHSEIGKGTTFRLIFPIRKVKTDFPTVEISRAIEPLQILCIDDEPLLGELLKELLERDGHTVRITDGGQAGLDVFRMAREQNQPFDLVFTDLGMPYVDGRLVAKTIKEESPGTPIIMLTGWGAFIKDDDTLPQQVDCVLSKPPRSREIRETIHTVTSSRNALRKNLKRKCSEALVAA